MATRHLSRSIVLQTLFEWDVQRERSTTVSIDNILKRNIKEFAPQAKDTSFTERLIAGVRRKQKEIDAIIERAAPEWPIEKISTIDRNILRIGLYELLFGDRSDVPPKVAINEAIELGKTFGGESSGRFINGVLGAVYKDIGEPGKEEQSAKKGKKEFPTEELCGSVIFARTSEGLKFAFVHDVFGHWTVSKAHHDAACEQEEECAARAAKNEMGLSVQIIAFLGDNEYTAAHPEKGKVRKHVSYYLAEAPYEDITLEKDGGLTDARWFSEQEVVALNFYDDIRPIVEQARTFIKEKKA